MAPHAIDEVAEADDALIARALGDAGLPDDFDWNNVEIDKNKDKDDNAVDYEDISDDDLADEEDPSSHTQTAAEREDDGLDDLFGEGGEDEQRNVNNDVAVEDDDDDLDELFGGRDGSSPPTSAQPPADPSAPSFDGDESAQAREPTPGSLTTDDTSFDRSQRQDVQMQEKDQAEESEDEDPEVREWRKMISRYQEQYKFSQGLSNDAPAEAPLPDVEFDEELFKRLFPSFRKDEPPRWSKIYPKKKARYKDRKPLKPPKPLIMNKVNLELEPDQEKLFRLPYSKKNIQLQQMEAAERGMILIPENLPKEYGEASDAESDGLLEEDGQGVGNVIWQNLAAASEEWIIPSGEDTDEADDIFDDNSWETQAPPNKKQKTSHMFPLQNLLRVKTSYFDEPEKATARLARKIQLDLNDTYMLLDIQEPDTPVVKKRSPNIARRDEVGNVTERLAKRYNTSNDEAYDMLKENHQSKSRSNLGNITIEHSMPASKLQYPFYKVKLSQREARSFHRPHYHITPGTIFFEKQRIRKRKHMKGLDVPALFDKAENLSQADNADMMLLEYSEEYPIMLSKFGMGSRLINYYRRRDEQDTARPKLPIGETSVLLPQDKSPFSVFGDVEGGQTTPTIHNSMYRAPVYKHDSDHRDFLFIRSTTGTDGAKYYLRNIENLHVVGQEFPLVEVPGPHARAVTNAAKRRLHMLSYRIYMKNTARGKRDALKNEMILKHLPGSDIAQNRSKMREFMDYDKERGWVPKQGQVLPDTAEIRTLVKPEDICLLESMQFGERQLEDAGYNKGADETKEDDAEKEGQSLDQKLAPWNTTKNFLAACQNKAMLQLHGEGDPTGRGEAFNFIRTSMKGGFRDIGASVEDRIDDKRRKELGGHTYNVAQQQTIYNNAIKRIWNAQEKSLSSTFQHDDVEMDNNYASRDGRATPMNGRGPTPSIAGHDTSSVVSRNSEANSNKVMKITRTFYDKNGRETVQEEIVRDPKVINQYKKRRREIYSREVNPNKFTPTGDPEIDRLQREKMQEELDRLLRNKERREARELAKGKGLPSGASPGSPDPGSPAAAATVEGGRPGKKSAGGTQRRCANCGQVGHIKTNKKLCPKLNGTEKQEDGFGDSAFGSIPAVGMAGSPPAQQQQNVFAGSPPANGFGSF